MRRVALQEPPPDDLIQSMPVNSKDRCVLALAVHVQADCIATFDPDELLDTLITRCRMLL